MIGVNCCSLFVATKSDNHYLYIKLQEEKKLEEVQRSGNCVVKKFKKHQEGRLERDLFIAQVELRLI